MYIYTLSSGLNFSLMVSRSCLSAFSIASWGWMDECSLVTLTRVDSICLIIWFSGKTSSMSSLVFIIIWLGNNSWLIILLFDETELVLAEAKLWLIDLFTCVIGDDNSLIVWACIIYCSELFSEILLPIKLFWK